jgi:hypothetical protein
VRIRQQELLHDAVRACVMVMVVQRRTDLIEYQQNYHHHAKQPDKPGTGRLRRSGRDSCKGGVFHQTVVDGGRLTNTW